MQVAIFFAIDNTGWPTTHHLQIACVFSGTADDSKNFPQVKDWPPTYSDPVKSRDLLVETTRP